MHEPGEIYNRDRARQLIDFSGMKFGNITPTDIDGLIEYKNKYFIIIELKHKDNEMPFGQKLALERMCDVLSMKKTTIVLLGTHDVPVSIDIDCAKVIVKEYYFNKKWTIFNKTVSMHEAVDNFIHKQEQT